MNLNSVRQEQGSRPTKAEDRPLVPPGTFGAPSGPCRMVDGDVSGEAGGCEVYTNATLPPDIVAPIPMRSHVVSPLLKAYEVDEGSSSAASEAGGFSFTGESCAEQQQQHMPSSSNDRMDGSLEPAEAQSLAELNAMLSAPWTAIHNFESEELTCVWSIQFARRCFVAAATRDRDGDMAMANGSPMTSEDQAPDAVQGTPYSPFPSSYHKYTSVTTSSQLLYVPQTGDLVSVDVAPRMDMDGDVVMDEALTNYSIY
ncbi:hypothetical protein VP1G_01755 [Cytospora mali]|uniref:Uncharacterized protein n=1 Tax=Cytospora mali TaxID=578113 RepID=A0A194URP9_CYTMA|nr:hypothetical protein VP1G_01755 [Valsa mali var. pyri (nom. inval.)]